MSRYDDGKAILRAIVSLPESIRMREEYESLTNEKNTETSKEHHDSYSAFQKCFYNDVQNLFNSFHVSFDPFSNQTSPLLSYVNNGKVVDNCIELDRSIRSIESKGQQLHENFAKNV